MNSAFKSTASPSVPCDAISAATMVAAGCISVSSMSFPLLTKCKCENSHGISRGEDARFSGTHSMQRSGAIISQAPLSIDRQPRLDAINVPLAGVFKPLARQIARLVAQGHVYIDLLVHGGIVGCLQRKFHSYFPVVVFVHEQIVGRATQQRNAEISRNST